MLDDIPLTFASLRKAYAGGLSPVRIIERVYARIEQVADPHIFLCLFPKEDLLTEAAGLGAFDADKPLWGVPFVIKDNIDVAGKPTTAACPEFAYVSQDTAFVVKQLLAAGALLIGKTNLDQFATGLVGVRTPCGAPKNALDPDIVPGGSSGGSGIAVAHGIASFSLGTDTAGSGRVPAALNNIVGLKPTLGALSASGVIPACRTLDTVSIFALTVEDAYEAYSAAAAYDPTDSPGHSPGGISLFERKTGILFAADAIYDGPLFNEGPGMSVADYRKTFDLLKSLPIETVHGGHDPSFGRIRMLEIIAHYEAIWDAV